MANPGLQAAFGNDALKFLSVRPTLSRYSCSEYCCLTDPPIPPIHAQSLAAEIVSTRFLWTAGSIAATSNADDAGCHLPSHLHTRNMGYTTDWRHATCLWACILLSSKCICFAATLHDNSLIDSQYTCYDGNFLCPVLHGEPTFRCGPDCFLPGQYSCVLPGHCLPNS